MEYFSFNYKNVDQKISFNNYDSFVTNMKAYKYYLFDLSLIRHDPKISQENKNKAKSIIIKQKVLFFLPYFFIFPIIYFYNKRNFFSVGMINKEIKLVSYLIGFLLTIRIAQKALLKYEGDKMLVDISKNKEYSF